MDGLKDKLCPCTKLNKTNEEDHKNWLRLSSSLFWIISVYKFPNFEGNYWAEPEI